MTDKTLTKIMLISKNDECIIKISEHRPIDVDEDGTKYNRCIVFRMCGCNEYIKIKTEEVETFIQTQLASEFKILEGELGYF